MELPIYQIDAFADELFQGNPAAVCPLEAWIPEALMQSIAAENNLSETAFFVRAGDLFEIRWFTPLGEVDLCGHATLASAYVILNHQYADHGPLVFQSASGELRVTPEGDLLQLDFPAINGKVTAIFPELVDCLGVQPEEVFTATDHMVVLPSEESLVALEPDFGKMKALSVRGVIATAPGSQVDFVSRFFAPSHGIDEDPVTGSAHCLLTPYWAERLGKTLLSARQLSRRGGSLQCQLSGDRVLISGKAVPYLEGIIQI